MSIDALIKAVRDTVVSEAYIKRIEDRLTESERKFEEESRRNVVTEEFLQKRITI